MISILLNSKIDLYEHVNIVSIYHVLFILYIVDYT